MLVYSKCNTPFKLLYWFFVCSVFAEISGSLLYYYFNNNMPGLHVFTVIEMCTYFGVFRKLFGSDRFQTNITTLGIVLVVSLAFVEAFLLDGIWYFNTLTRSTGAFLLVLLSLRQLQLSIQLNDPVLLKRPYFWLLVGVLSYFATSFLFFIFVRISLAHNKDIFMLSNSIHIGMNILCNGIFAYSFLCYRKTTV
jgi:hypothetical protein